MIKGKILLQYVVGGLAPDSDQAMPEPMQDVLQNTWRAIQQQIPGTDFNFDFWVNCQPRRSTYPACRAVLAAKRQDAELEMISGIQEAYYLNAQNPSDLTILEMLADEIGLNSSRFAVDILSEVVQSELIADINLGRKLGAQGFPSLVLERFDNLGKPTRTLLDLDYNSPELIINQIL